MVKSYTQTRTPVIKAIQYNEFKDYGEIVEWMVASEDTHAKAGEVKYSTPLILFPSIFGMQVAQPGDYIAKHEDGSFSAFQRDAFEKFYRELTV